MEINKFSKHYTFSTYIFVKEREESIEFMNVISFKFEMLELNISKLVLKDILIRD